MTSPPRAIVSAVLLTAFIVPTSVFSKSESNNLKVRTTAYTHSESDHLKYGRKTALGTRLQNTRSYTSAAADWSRFPVGTTFKIEGMKTTFIIDDYGSALVGTDTIDLYHPSKSSMNRWGVRHVNIEIIKFGDYERSRHILAQRTKYSHCRRMLAAIPEAQDEPKRRWFWSRKPKADAAAPDPRPAPAPEPPRKPEANPSPPVMLASNSPAPAKASPPPPPKSSPIPQPKPRPEPKPAPAPAPAPAPTTPDRETRHHAIQLASTPKSPAEKPAPAPAAPAIGPQAPALADASSTATATPPTSGPAAPRSRAVTPIRSVASAPVVADEPVAATRESGSPSAVTLASADAGTAADAPAIFAIARPNSAVPHRKREVRALPAGFRPATMN